MTISIHAAQLDTFRGVEYERFIGDMQKHIARCFPEESRQLSQEKTRQLIENGIKRAEQHAIVSERGVCKFIDLSLVFGAEFDTDANNAWASKILLDPAIYDPKERIDRLFSAAESVLQQKDSVRGNL